MSRGADASWIEPGAHEVTAGVHRVPLPLPTDGLRAVNVYVLESDAGLTCIDGGWAIPESRALFEESLRSIGHHPRDITSFLVTHMHRDHYTQATAIREEFGRAVVSLGEGDRPAVEANIEARGTVELADRITRCGAADLAREWAGQFPPEVPGSAADLPDRWLAGDFDVEVGPRTLRAVHTPGHTPGHYVFADLDAGVLFAGDHVLPTITPSIGFVPGLPGESSRRPLADFLGSLTRLRQLPDLRVLPAHGDVDRRSHERVAELLAHHDVRLGLCRDAVAGGAVTALDVAHTLPWTRREHAFADLDAFNAALAVLETALHLDVLVMRGDLERVTIDGVDTYAGADPA
jgi:glyoxylase-like metal-dependent hydrolase (beta-lactamase superfamily II)